MKRFTPFWYFVILSLIYVVAPVVAISLSWKFLGSCGFTSCCTVIGGGFIILFPIVLYKNRENASVVVSQTTIENYINDDTLNVGWIEEIVNIKSMQITNAEECQKYYKNCKAKKALLIDFGNGNVKYIPVTQFTKWQINKMIKTITERQQALKDTQ